MGATNSKLVQVEHPPACDGNGHILNGHGPNTGAETLTTQPTAPASTEYRPSVSSIVRVDQQGPHNNGNNKQNGFDVKVFKHRTITGNMDPIFEIPNQRARVRLDLIESMHQEPKDSNGDPDDISGNNDADNDDNANKVGDNDGDKSVDTEPEMLVLSKPVYDGQLNVQQADDSVRCDITGCAVLGDDKIAIADNWNGSVKVFTLKNRSFLSSVHLDVKPWDIAALDSSQQLVCTCNNSLTILNIAADIGTLTVDTIVPVQGRSRGIACHNNVFIVSFAQPDPSVKLIQQNGHVLKSIHSDPATGTQLFKRPEYVAFHTKHKLIYVSDFQTNSVTCLSLEGEVRSRYVDSDLKKPTGLAIDSRGYVLLAGWGSEDIHKFTKDCEGIQTVLQSRDIITYPQALAFYKNTLYMSHYHFTSICNYLSAYRLDDVF